MRRPRVVILGGAGAMGRIAARDLARTAGKSIEVVLADRDLAPAKPLGLPAVRVDVTDPRSLARALRGAAVVIASLPYRFNLAAMAGALEARAHYVDLGGLFHVTRRQLELGPAFRRAGRTAILGMGSSPGIMNVLAVHAAEGLERVLEVHCMVGAVDRTRFRSAPPLGFGYSVDTLLDELAMPAALFRRGKLAMVPALAEAERRDERFPKPIGKIRLDTTLHSEVATLPRHFASRGVREVTFRQGFDPGFAEKLALLVRLGLAGTEPLPGTALSPRAVFQALLAALPPAVPAGKPDRYEILRVLVRGRKAGRPASVTADCHADRNAGFGTGPDIDTGAPPSIAAQMLLSGEIEPRPGVFAPEEIVPVQPFIRELERRGMVVKRSRRQTA